MYKISVIVPAYNAQNQLNRCLTSLMKQTYPTWEVLVINDGSTDETPSILEKWQKECPDKIRVFHQQNGGAASARNRGLEAASGDYIAFLDADDYWDHDTLEKLIDCAQKTEADIVRFGLCYEYPDGRVQKEVLDFPAGEVLVKDQFPKWIYAKMLKGISLNSVCRTLFSKQVIAKLLFDEKMQTAEDLLFCMEAFTRAKRFVYLNDIWYHYDRGQGGLTGKGLSVFKKYQCNWRISRALLSYLKTWDMNTVKNRLLAIWRLAAITYGKLKQN